MARIDRREFLSFLGFAAAGAALDVSRAPFRAAADGTSDQTAGFQAAIDRAAEQGGGTVEVPAGVHRVVNLELRPRVLVSLLPGAVLLAPDGVDEFHHVVRAADLEEVGIIGAPGAAIDGNRSGQRVREGEEQRHAVQLKGVGRFVIRDVTLRNAAGDGLVLGSTSRTGACGAGVVENVQSDGNFRNGLSVVSAKDVIFRGCRFSGTEGVDPGAGVDLEPNGPTDRLEDLRFVDCIAEGNREGAGFLVSPARSPRERNAVVFRGCIARDNAYGFRAYMARAERFTGEYRWIGCTAHHNNRNGFLLRSARHVELVRCRAVSNGRTATNLETGAAFAVFKGPRDERGPADVRLIDCEAVDRMDPRSQQPPLWVDSHARDVVVVRFRTRGYRSGPRIEAGADIRIESARTEPPDGDDG